MHPCKLSFNFSGRRRGANKQAYLDSALSSSNAFRMLSRHPRNHSERKFFSLVIAFEKNCKVNKKHMPGVKLSKATEKKRV